MAVIQKIRERYAKLAGAVIALSLVAFIISEGVNGRFGNFFGTDTSIAKVNGQSIDQREYSELTRDYISLSEVFRKGQRLSEQEQAQLRQQVIDQMVTEKIVEKECDKLGIVVSEAEQKDMISGANPDPTVQQFFTTVFGVQAQQFDPSMVKQFESEVKKSDEPKLLELGQQWEALKKFVIRSRRIQKYNTLVAGSAYTPKAIQMQNAAMENTLVGFRYVKIPYTSIPDAEIPVSEAEMKDYMQRHKAQFTTDQPTRRLEYVAYDVVPSEEDTARALGALQKIRDQFATESNVEPFVNRNSEERYTNTFVNKSRYMSRMADTIFKGGVGSVTGPFFENGNYKLVKIVEVKSMPDSVKAQHILIATASQQNPQGPTDTVAHQRADSLFAAIKAGANFDSLAAKFSDDPGSKVKGGDLGYFGYGMMVPEFNEYVFSHNNGEMGVVKTQFGWHIIRVKDQKNFAPAYKLATISKSLNIGQKADQTQFARANEFAGANRTGAAFDAAVKKNGLDKKIAESVKPEDYVIPGLGPSRDIIRWAYGAKVGEVSDPIHLENRYVVAKVSAINEPGLRPLDESIKPQIEMLVRSDKKAKMIADKYKGATSVEAIAQQSGNPVSVADSVNGNASFSPGLGYAPKVVGYAFNDKFQPNTISPAIKEREGVFFIQLNHRTPTGKQVDPQALAMQAKMQDMQTRNMIAQAINESLRRRNDVKFKPENIY
jgi:peptidyl-prolyl cis-trans isomerase D